MRKVINYQIVGGCDQFDLQKYVRNNCAEWHPIGGPFIDDNGWYRQAMILYQSPLYIRLWRWILRLWRRFIGRFKKDEPRDVMYHA